MWGREGKRGGVRALVWRSVRVCHECLGEGGKGRGVVRGVERGVERGSRVGGERSRGRGCGGGVEGLKRLGPVCR